MKNSTDPTRRYTKDLVSNETVVLTAVDWTDNEKRIVAKAPADNCFAALVAPDAEQP